MDQKDLEQIGKLIQDNNNILMGSVDKKFKDNNDILSMLIDLKFDKFENRLEQKILDWKSEIVDSVDTLAKEMRDEREFRDISSHQTSSILEELKK